MQDNSGLKLFISSSPYTNPVDIKKLKFIYSTIEKYCHSKNKKIEELNILEVACGQGGTTFPLASLGCQIRTFDIDERCVEHVQSKISKEEIQNIQVTVDNALTFNEQKTYDIVVASEVFEHVLIPSKLLENIVKRMKNGCYLIVTIPNGFGPWEMRKHIKFNRWKQWNFLRHIFGKLPYTPKGNGHKHCHFFTKTKFERTFSRSSFKRIDFMKSDSFLVMFSSVRSGYWGNIDIKLADILPYMFASGWFFVFELTDL